MPKNIVLKGNPIRKELAAGGAITPGHLVDFDASGDLIPHDAAGANAAPAFAVEQDFLGKSITDVYALNDRVQYVVGRQGDEILAWLNETENVNKGEFLESAGNGRLQEHVPTLAENASLIIGTATSNNAIEFVARRPGETGNDITVEVDQGSGSIGISVVGTAIVISVTTGGDTANDIIAALADSAAAMELVSVGLAPGSNGSGTLTAPVSETNLEGGLDTVFRSIVARALEDCNASTSNQRIRVEVL